MGRPVKFLVLVGALLVVVVGASAAWFALPRLFPQEVLKYSPFPSLALRTLTELNRRAEPFMDYQAAEEFTQRVQTWGHRATPALVAAIAGRRTAESWHGLEFIGHTHDLAAIPALLVAAADGDERFAESAFEALATFDDDAIVLPLITACRAAVAQRWRMYYQSARLIRDEAIIAECLRLLRHGDEERRERAALALAFTDSRDIQEALTTALRDPCSGVVRGAALALHWRDQVLDPMAIVRCVDDRVHAEHAAIQVEILWQGPWSDPEVALALCRWLTTPGDDKMRAYAAYALKADASELGAASLIAALRDPSETVRYWAACAFDQRVTTACVSDLIDLLHDADERVVRAALLALERQGGDVVAEAVLSFAETSPDRSLRDAALRIGRAMPDLDQQRRLRCALREPAQ